LGQDRLTDLSSLFINSPELKK
jgi:hypothetical protein